MDVLARGNNTATQRKMPTVIAKKHNALFLFLFGAIRHPKQRDSTETKTPEQKAKSMSGTTMSAITTDFKRSKTLTGKDACYSRKISLWSQKPPRKIVQMT